MSILNKLTIVSITYNDPGIINTMRSTESLRCVGCCHIIQNGGDPINSINFQGVIYNESDKGIYDAINKAIKKVKTEFFILLHAGDTIIANNDTIKGVLEDLEKTNSNFSLNSQYIGNRLHSSRLWKPWMIYFGSQPPHMPTIYRTSAFATKMYDTRIDVISDFNFFLNDVDYRNYINSGKILIQMETGGRTSSGLKSIIQTSFLFIKYYKFRGIIFAICRFPLKLISAIK